MDWNITSGRPVYLQLVEQLELAVITGVYPPGEKVPPVRELAAEAGVNPNTMQRALQELEARGLMESRRTAGRTVTADATRLKELRHQRAAAQAKAFMEEMEALGLTKDEVLHLLEEEE